MKKQISRSLLFIFLCLFPVCEAYAYARAPFPDGKSLQPMPEIAHPNVSGNVNSSNSVAPEAELIEQNDWMLQTEPPIDEEILAQESQTVETGSGTTFTIFFAIVGLVMSIAVLWIVRMLWVRNQNPS